MQRLCIWNIHSTKSYCFRELRFLIGTQIEEKLMWYAFFCTVWVTNEVEIEQVLQKLTMTLTVTDFRFVITNTRSMLTIF